MCIGYELNTIAGSVDNQSTEAHTVAALRRIRICVAREEFKNRKRLFVLGIISYDLA